MNKVFTDERIRHFTLYRLMRGYSTNRGIQMYLLSTNIEKMIEQFFFSLSPRVCRELQNGRLPHQIKIRIDETCIRNAIQWNIDGVSIRHRERIIETIRRNPKLVQKLKQTLNEKEQQILILWGINTTCTAISQQMEMPLPSVKWMLNKIRIKIRNSLNNYRSGPVLSAA